MSLYSRIAAELSNVTDTDALEALLLSFKDEIEAMEANSTAYLDQDASYYYQGKEDAL
jgi:hypothetical protein